ncbi:unnamed protein product [marine sediment metagenome]|uniref:Uncharacterized protein n=1 Tax=marine sediment metagenome TaxID=412755 RepID=X1V5Y4_9ZZZZ
MGDISFATTTEVVRILQRIGQFPLTNFLIQSKNPKRFRDWGVSFPSNVYLATTIETNRGYNLTKAPFPVERYTAIASFNHPHKFISIEPIMNFDLDILFEWMERIEPEIIEIGADNYSNHLPEPPWWKVEALLKSLSNFCPKVIEKQGLERLNVK